MVKVHLEAIVRIGMLIRQPKRIHAVKERYIGLLETRAS